MSSKDLEYSVQIIWTFFMVLSCPFILIAWRRAVWTFLKTSPFLFLRRKYGFKGFSFGWTNSWISITNHRSAADLSLSVHVSLLGLSTVSILCLLSLWSESYVLPSYALFPLNGASAGASDLWSCLRADPYFLIANLWSNWQHYYINKSCALQS